MSLPLCTRSALLAAIAAVLPLGSGFGQSVIAEYPFLAGDWTSHAETTAATASDIVNAAVGSITGTGLHFFKRNTDGSIPDSLAAALANDHYLGLTVTPTNHEVSYTSFAFEFGLSNNTGSVNPYTGYWAVFSSATGFFLGEAMGTGEFSLPSGSGLGAIWGPAALVDLAGIAALQETEEPVEFRIYLWQNTSTTTSNLIMRLDSIVVSANTVPLAPGEPTLPDLMVALEPGEILKLTWYGEMFHTYILESSTSPDSESFQPTGQQYTPAQAGPMEATVIAEGERLFVRVRAELAGR